MYKSIMKRCTIAMALSIAFVSGANAEDSLYHEFGGEKAMTAVVDQFLWNLADDERINHFFVETNLLRFREKLLEYFCLVSDGPCNYTGDDMIRTHANLGISVADFNVVVENLINAMKTEDINTASQNRLLKRLAQSYSDVVNVPPASHEKLVSK